MKAVVLTGEGLAVHDVPAPEPKPNEVLVKVAASGLNRADLIMAAGKPHGALGGAGAIAGLEWAGEVAAVGADVPEFKPGDQVMCSGAGGYAEYAVTDWGRVCPMPKATGSPVEAATLPIALQTMHDALVCRGAKVGRNPELARIAPNVAVAVGSEDVAGAGTARKSLAESSRAKAVNRPNTANNRAAHGA